MTDDLIERTATALAKSHGLDFDEVCGVDASPDDGYCDSGTCIASGYEDHDAAYARACYRSDARAAIAIIAPSVLDMAAGVARSECNGRRLAMEAAKAKKLKSEARDFESMMMQAGFIETDILAIKAQFEGDGK